MTDANPPPKQPPAKWIDALLLLLLTLLPLLFFWRLITPNALDRMDIAAGDFTEQYFPLRAFVAQQWVRLEIPLWNPYLYGGQPALADIQSGALYPIHLVQALLLGWLPPLFGREIGFPLQALEWQVILHFSLAGLGTYLFARHLFLRGQGQHTKATLRRARFGALITSLSFTYSGYLTGFPVQQLTILEVSAWLPWLFWGLNLTIAALEARTRGGATAGKWQLFSPTSPLFYTVLGAIVFALAFLAGHPQTAMYIVYFSLAYTVVQLVMNNEQRTKAASEQGNVPQAAYNIRQVAQRNWLYLVCWALMVLLGAALAAAQLLPTLEFIRHSVRAELSYQAVSAGLPLNELVAILYPGFFGGSPQYVGIVSLVLIALALFLARPRYDVYFWAGSGLVSLLLSFGSNLFVYPLFYLLLPGFAGVRQQERVLLIFSFSAAVLAGYGAMLLVTPLAKAARQRFTLFEKRLWQVALVAALLTALFIYGSAAATARADGVNLFYGVLWHHLFGLLMLLGLLALLALRRRRRLRRWWGMALLAAWLAFNLFTVNWRYNLEEPAAPPPFTPNGVTHFLQANLADTQGRVASGGYLPHGNSAAAVHQLQDITGNTPLHLAQVATFLQQTPAWRLWQLLNVRYVVDRRDISDAGLKLAFAGEDGSLLFEMGDPFARAWLVADTEVIADDAQTLAWLANDSVDLRQSAAVSQALPVPLAAATPATVTVTEAGVASLRLSVDTAAHQLLVISQIFYPGWRAEINNRPAELLRVNSVLQGIVVPPGQNEVLLTYWSATFQWGALISGVALLFCVAILCISLINLTITNRT